MSYTMSMDQKPNALQNIKQLQRLIMTRQMQQAINLLQMPVMELSPIIDMELEQNPVLELLDENNKSEEELQDVQESEEEANEETAEQEDRAAESQLDFDERDFEILKRLDEDFRDHFSEGEGYQERELASRGEKQNLLEKSIPQEKKMFEILMTQAREVFLTENEMALAEILIGNLNEKGFLEVSLQELSLLHKFTIEQLETALKVIQTFEPVGIGARSLQEALLIQLRKERKEETLAYKIIENHFDDLLGNHIPIIKKSLHATNEEINAAIDRDIAKLELNPGGLLAPQPISYISPDITLKQEGDAFITFINDENIPSLRLNRRYLKMLDDETVPAETKEFIRHKIISAKWLLRNIFQRNSTLEKIANSLAKWQKDYFLDPNGKLVALTMQTLADELEMHESTIARAVANKYIFTPRGLQPLRFFFKNALTTSQGNEISTETVRDLLKDMIDNEDKSHPLSDEALSHQLKTQGIQCARRTIAKYRNQLNLAPAQQRKKYKN